VLNLGEIRVCFGVRYVLLSVDVVLIELAIVKEAKMCAEALFWYAMNGPDVVFIVF
jgi:hypothetical protein